MWNLKTATVLALTAVYVVWDHLDQIAALLR